MSSSWALESQAGASAVTAPPANNQAAQTIHGWAVARRPTNLNMPDVSGSRPYQGSEVRDQGQRSKLKGELVGADGFTFRARSVIYRHGFAVYSERETINQSAGRPRLPTPDL